MKMNEKMKMMMEKKASLTLCSKALARLALLLYGHPVDASATVAHEEVQLHEAQVRVCRGGIWGW